MHLGIGVTNDILHHDLSVPYVRDEIKRFSQRYGDRMEKYPNILATNLMKTIRLSQNNTPTKKKITSRFMYPIVL